MTPNAHLAIVLMGAAMLTGFARVIAGPVLDVLPLWAEGVLSGAGTCLTVTGLVIAIAAYRERPLPPCPRNHQEV